MNNRAFESVVFVFAQTFNRRCIPITFLFSFIIGYSYYQQILTNLGYKIDGKSWTADERARIGICLTVFYFVSLAFNVMTT